MNTYPRPSHRIVPLPPPPSVRRPKTIQVRHPWIEAETTREELALRDLRALQYLRSRK